MNEDKECRASSLLVNNHDQWNSSSLSIAFLRYGAISERRLEEQRLGFTTLGICV